MIVAIRLTCQSGVAASQCAVASGIAYTMRAANGLQVATCQACSSASSQNGPCSQAPPADE